jgi:hypothetical protein
VENPNSFKFYKDSGKTIQQNIKILPVSREAPLSITTEKFVVKNIKDNPFVIASIGISFTWAYEKNIKNMIQEIE